LEAADPVGVVLTSKRELNRIDVLARLDGGRLTTDHYKLMMLFDPISTACIGRRSCTRNKAKRGKQLEATICYLESSGYRSEPITQNWPPSRNS
jgi:hypothetical protein